MTVVVNPNASTGVSASLWRDTSEILSRRSAGYRELRTLGDADDPERIAEVVRAEGPEVLVAAGGDGTVSAVVEAIVRIEPERRPVLALFPFGTANNVARSLGLVSGRHGGASALRSAIETALGGRDRTIDLGRVGDRHFLGSFALGMDADILALRNRYTRRFAGSRLVRGYPLYLWCTAQCLARSRVVRGSVSVDGASVAAASSPLFNLLVTNTAVYAGEFRFHADDPSSDGRLDTHAFGSRADFVARYTAAWIRQLRHERGRRVASPSGLHSGRSIRVELEQPTNAQVDGEELGRVDGCEITVAADALTIRVP